MQLEIYNTLKTRLDTLVTSGDLKIVGLWNNQFDREKENVSFGFPCCFIEFINTTYTDQTQGVQSYEMDVNIHIGFKSFATTDTTILTLKQTVNAILHTYSAAGMLYETKLLRRSETQNFDHDNVQDYITTYHISGKDFGVNNLPDTDATVDTLTTTLDPIITNFDIRTASPEIS